MSTFAVVLKRLYSKGEVTKAQVKERVTSGKLTKEDHKSLTGDPYAK